MSTQGEDRRIADSQVLENEMQESGFDNSCVTYANDTPNVDTPPDDSPPHAYAVKAVCQNGKNTGKEYWKMPTPDKTWIFVSWVNKH